MRLSNSVGLATHCARALLVLGALICVGGVAFVWGVFAHRDHIFPYRFLRFAGSQSLGMTFVEQVKVPPQAVAQLVELGYAEATFDINSELSGVVVSDFDRALPGVNLYNSRTAKSAQLIDLAGAVIHEWKYETPDAWQSVDLLPGGGLLVVEKDRALHFLDAESHLLWSFPGEMHHDLDVFEGEIYALNRQIESRPGFDEHAGVLVDFVSVIAFDGTEKKRILILDLVEKSPYAFLLPSFEPGLRNTILDVLHINHIEVLDGSLEHRSAVFKKGNLLLSSRNLNAIFVVDPSAKEIVWLWGPGNLTFQHHPQLLENGNILVFDNGIEASRVIEVEPLDREIVWSYESAVFFSRTRGSVQRLSNGNTLITESDTGYVFEVDGTGAVVWEFANPDIDEFGKRSAIWRMTRYDPSEVTFLPNRMTPPSSVNSPTPGLP